MPSGIEADPHGGLRLILGQDSTLSYGMGYGGIKVIYADVQVQHHLLMSRTGWPYRSDVVRLRLEGQPGLPSGAVSFT